MRSGMSMGVILFLLTACQALPEKSVVTETQDQKVFSYRLDNGMNILVQPDHRSPVVVSQVWY